MADVNYDINYDDKRFTQVTNEKNQALTENEQMYDGMISQSDKFYQDQINASKDWEKTQTQIQNQQTDFAIEQINQQKDQAKKDYLKEQSGAYVDWQKQSDEYGANAEQMAAQGMTQTGFAESTQTSMYNTYQNRVATAREAYGRAVLNYDNAIKDARLQNNAKLAEIAYQALQQQLGLALEGFQYKNTLLQTQADKKLAIDEMYHGRWQDVLSQMNTENALAEQIRQHNESLAEEKRQFNESMAFEREQYEYQKEQAAAKSSGGGGGGGSGGGGGGSGGGGGGGKIQQPKGKSGGDGDGKSGGMSAETRDSLLNAGLAGASPETVAKEIEAGRLRKLPGSNGNNTTYVRSVPTSFGPYVEQKLKDLGLK